MVYLLLNEYGVLWSLNYTGILTFMNQILYIFKWYEPKLLLVIISYISMRCKHWQYSITIAYRIDSYSIFQNVKTNCNLGYIKLKHHPCMQFTEILVWIESGFLWNLFCSVFLCKCNITKLHDGSFFIITVAKTCHLHFTTSIWPGYTSDVLCWTTCWRRP